MREIRYQLSNEYFDHLNDLRSSIEVNQRHGFKVVFNPVREEMSTDSEIEMLKLQRDFGIETIEWIG
ncbi:hypothetical protein KL86PLE_130516 [uncultured Pleomorphomonas sp.]|uniref:Uncharacterized protein n=1 Tax=uncultured Pleomorphomonas sp. TaxID=442121 RepID=A0A212LC56_9HYPH|nr:hypothetical protein [uncultured Pleomorphomonas sp.]SCM70053.1 hypothetical protein KL86PLE_10019 [uncultured Pleomorphomonas sp.]SCM75115.1 hypothetical protein KL86PLE_130516 [uncultured Pleomorphomonas sp.]